MPLKVLQIATSFPSWGGTELHILNLSSELLKRGHEVTIACRPGGWVESQAAERGIETFACTLRKQHDWSQLATLRRVMRDRRFDVLHVHWNSDILVPGYAGLVERVPVRILSRHVPHRFRSRVGGFLFGRYLYSQVVSVSESVRQVMIQSGVPPNRAITIHHGTDADQFRRLTKDRDSVRLELGLLPADVAINLPGRMTPEKGHGDVLASLNLLRELDGVKVVFTGEGPLLDHLRQQAETLELGERVVFTGFRADIADVLNAMDVVVVPSTWEEPCSAVVQQGMVLSKPVVGTRVGGTPEMIVEGVTGIVVAPGDPVALASALRSLVLDPAMRERMGREGRARVEQHFSLSGMTDRIERLYASGLTDSSDCGGR
jgi:glycosyltransferase involved in cell wall biosynthesis